VLKSNINHILRSHLTYYQIIKTYINKKSERRDEGGDLMIQD
jgi:hypothetical protein